jgi:YD repeat-containing protein
MSGILEAARCAFVRVLILGLAGFLAAPVLAQIQPPPQKDTVSETGVSYARGSFSHSKVDLSIGDGEFPSGLSLKREYNSSLDGAFEQGLSQGWTTNWSVMVVTSPVPPLTNFPQQPGTQKFLYSVVLGSRRIGFFGGTTYPTGGPIGTYTPAEPGGQSLVYTGDNPTGHYTFTDSDGTVVEFLPGVWVADTITAPDGTVAKFYWDSSKSSPTAIFSSRGYALLFEPGAHGWSKACVVNLAQHYVTATSACPADAPSTSYGFSVSPNNAGYLLTSVTDASGGTTRYSYVGMDHLGCITPPGALGCQVSNTYNVCHRDPDLREDPPGLRLSDQVLSQTLADGRSFTYSFQPNPQCPAPANSGNDIVRTASDGTTREVATNAAGIPATVTDELHRVTHLTYVTYFFTYARVTGVTHPEGDSSQFNQWDARGNYTQETLVPKPGSGLANRTRTAAFPADCTYRTSCNKPVSVTDWKGNSTAYTYDPVHGGVLTEIRPAADKGVQPVKRYAYVQLYAWLAAAGGGYARAATPVWLPAEERTCRTTATVGSQCAGGAGDEVVTAYDYGPDAGPNTLLLRGQTISADGQTRRTCYGYDWQGNRISATTPRAGLASCP